MRIKGSEAVFEFGDLVTKVGKNCAYRYVEGVLEKHGVVITDGMRILIWAGLELLGEIDMKRRLLIAFVPTCIYLEPVSEAKVIHDVYGKEIASI